MVAATLGGKRSKVVLCTSALGRYKRRSYRFELFSTLVTNYFGNAGKVYAAIREVQTILSAFTSAALSQADWSHGSSPSPWKYKVASPIRSHASVSMGEYARTNDCIASPYSVLATDKHRV